MSRFCLRRPTSRRLLPLVLPWLIGMWTLGCEQEESVSSGTTDAGTTEVAGDGSGSKARLVFEFSEPTSDGNVAWKDDFVTLPSCTPPAGGFTAPTIPKQKGPLWLLTSAKATPIGAVERVEIVAVGADDKRDASANGQPTLTADTGVSVIEVGPMVAGVAVAKVRVDVEGPTTVTAGFDGKTATLPVHGFASQLPRVELQLDETALAAMLGTPSEKIWSPATLRYDGKTYPAKARLHGGSSRYFDKESFRVDLEDGVTLPNGRRRLIFRAEYVDKTMLRNFLAFDLFRGATPLPASDTEYVHFRVNDRFWGVMLLVERVDRDYLERRGMQPHGSLYEADPPLELSSPGGNFTPLPDLETYRTVYQHHAGVWKHDDLIVFIEDFLQRPDSEIAADLDRIVAIDEVIVYLATMMVLQNHDMVRKNFYFYRPVDGADKRWRFIPWDLDVSFGHLWTEENDILDENIFHDGEPLVGKNFGHPFFNRLIDRIYASATLRARLRSFVQHLIDGPFRQEVLGKRIDAMACHIGADLAIDPQKRAENDELAQRVQELHDFITARRTWLQAWIDEAP